MFSNDWWYWVWNTYSMSILGIPIAVGFVLKIFAVFNPNVPTNEILDVFKEYWPKGPPSITKDEIKPE
jgi:hypothetical protein